MRSLNQCQFIGNLGSDPEVRYMPSGIAVANFSIAVSDDYIDKQTGEKVEKTEWVRVVAFRKLAEIVSEHFKKGLKVFVSGKMTTEKYEKNGVDMYATKIILENFIFLSSKQDGGESRAYSDAPRQSSRAPQQEPQQPDLDDDIPF